MAIGEGELRVVDLPVGDGSAARDHAAGHIAIPVVRERLAVEPTQQFRVHRLQREVHVVDLEHRTAHGKRHVALQARLQRPRVHVAQPVLEYCQVLRIVLDGDVRTAATRPWQRFVDPRHISHRHTVAVQLHIVAHRQSAAPHHFGATMRAGVGQLKAHVVQPERIGHFAHGALHVAKPERWIDPHHVHLSHGQQHAHRIGLGEARTTECERTAHESIHANEPVSVAPHFAVESREVEGERTVALRPFERVGQHPR